MTDDVARRARAILTEYHKGCTNGGPGECAECAFGALRALEAVLGVKPLVVRLESRGGRWGVAGTDVTVKAVRLLTDAGCSIDDVVRAYPALTPDQVTAAREFNVPF